MRLAVRLGIGRPGSELPADSTQRSLGRSAIVINFVGLVVDARVGLSALRDLASAAVGDEVTVLPDHDVGLVTHPNNWVLRVELFKYQFA